MAVLAFGTYSTQTPTVAVPSLPSNFDVNQYVAPARIPESSASEPTGNFRFICEYSHLNFDDPILYPGQPGKAHLHVYFGNRLASASSNYENLRLTGGGSCQGGPINRSAYWMPAVLNASGLVVAPAYATVYYKATFGGIAGIQAVPSLPRGLVMIAGFDMATGLGEGQHWRCENGGPHQATIPACGPDDKAGASVAFPQCWDGVNLDSANHRSHLAYIFYSPDTGKPTCPTTHPVHIPEFTFTAWYPTPAGTNGWRLSSDMGRPAGSSLHSDWIGAWDDGILDTWTKKCLNGLLNCIGGELGDGRTLVGVEDYTGPSLIEPPGLPPVPPTSTTSTTTTTPTTSTVPGTTTIEWETKPGMYYYLRWRQPGGMWVTKAGVSSPYVVSGLQPGTYTFEVKAVPAFQQVAVVRV